MGCATGEISIPEKKKTSSERDQKLYPNDFFLQKYVTTPEVFTSSFLGGTLALCKRGKRAIPSTRNKKGGKEIAWHTTYSPRPGIIQKQIA